MAYSNNNIGGKLITDAISIGVGALAGIMTAGLASVPTAFVIKTGVGFAINESFDIIMNQQFDMLETGKNLSFAVASVGVGKAMSGLETAVAKKLNLQSLQQSVADTNKLLKTSSMATSKPLTSLLRVLKKVNKLQASSATTAGMATTMKDAENMGLNELVRSPDFLALNEDMQKSIKENLKSENPNDTHDESDGKDESKKNNDMKPISVKFLLKTKPKSLNQLIKANHDKHDKMMRNWNVDDFWKNRRKK